MPTRDNAMISGGILRGYFHDTASAAREGGSSNGCAFRGSYKNTPSPGASNLYLAPGELTRAGLIAGTREGILVSEVLGMHMVDPISGAFSVGISGLAVEKGSLTHPVKGAMIAGNLLEMLSRVDGVADDLIFYGSVGAPTFRVSALDGA